MNGNQLSNYVETTQIHPINAQYILDSQPHRLYSDADGNLLEIVVEKFAQTVAEKLYGFGGVIAVGYHDATTAGLWTMNTSYVLRPNGTIRHFINGFGELDDGIDMDILYMTLNPVEINNWYIQDPTKVDYSDSYDPKKSLQRLILQIRRQYLKIV